MTKVLVPGFQDRADVRLGPLVFNSYDINNVAWVITGIDGWWDLPEVQTVDDPRPYEQDGSYFNVGRYGPRSLSLQGTLIPPAGLQRGVPHVYSTIDLTSYAREALGNGVNLVRQTATLMIDENVPKQADVQLAGLPSFRNSKLNGALDFQIPLKAADPRKYSQQLYTITSGTARTLGGRAYPRTYNLTYPTYVGPPRTASVVNYGTYATGAVIRLNGPIQTPSVEHVESGNILTFNDTIKAGDYYELNLLDRTILLNGVSGRRSKMTVGSKWFTLAPGLNTLRYNGTLIGTGTNPQMDISYRSAWIY